MLDSMLIDTDPVQKAVGRHAPLRAADGDALGYDIAKLIESFCSSLQVGLNLRF